MAVKNGDKIKVEYTGKLNDGTVFDSSEQHGQPLEFVVGSGQIIKGFDEAVVGMELNEEKEFKVEPKNAYGDPNPMLIQKIPREKLPSNVDIKPGMMLGLQTPDGQQLPARVADVNEKEVTIDVNHPLAGKELNFSIKVIAIEPQA